VDFLDSVLESTRAKEEQVRKDTAEQLEAFRKQREVAEKALVDENAAKENDSMDVKSPAGEDSWATSSRKRRRAKVKEDEAVAKLRKKSSTIEDPPKVQTSAYSGFASPAPGRVKAQSTMNERKGDSNGQLSPKPKDVSLPRPSPQSSQSIQPSLGLTAYSSDED
jgi:ATPase subunit of ABC transporter with duplicated ATPase domains